ncbi:hypothetical protein DY052_05940 [Apilactobacillus timberlakei]|uniref:hypothetical protein n=1 Tax=Apilactobacillus timberlakei TaxID=2008380 RepID=UPI0011272CD0|nr:hypothetical protein [Apilactobacillus timberlakei]TPR14964.1 hypothetical protein DY052_05940 [Apilactobacillus timberlakei]
MSKKDDEKFNQNVLDKINKKRKDHKKNKKTDNRREYYEDNINYVFDALGYDGEAQQVSKLIRDHSKLHPINVNENTYKQISRIKKDHKIFSKNIVGMGIYLLYEIIYGDEFDIIAKKPNEEESKEKKSPNK